MTLRHAGRILSAPMSLARRFGMLYMLPLRWVALASTLWDQRVVFRFGQASDRWKKLGDVTIKSKDTAFPVAAVQPRRTVVASMEVED